MLMKRGKQTCRILREIRRQIAEANDIEFITSECQYQGECLGTCPKCEAEVRYLEQQLERKRMAGKAITVLGISAGLVATAPLTSCTSPKKPDHISTYDSIAETDTTETICMEMEGDIALKIDTPNIKDVSAPPSIPMVGEIPCNLQDSTAIDTLVVIEEEPIEGEVPEDNEAYVSACDNMPEFPGGTKALMEYLARNIKYEGPIAQGDIGISGRVIIQIIIDKEGNVTDPKVVRSVDPYLDKEALRVVSHMPKWTPGTQQGKPVAVKYSIPVVFRMQ
ncbi:MAG: energy transducer TonB [Bacteroides nordii]|nr:energy transducer TonB [Bacteroides nordii]